VYDAVMSRAFLAACRQFGVEVVEAFETRSRMGATRYVGARFTKPRNGRRRP